MSDSQQVQEKDVLEKIRQKCQELDEAKIRVEAEVTNIRSELEEETHATEALRTQLLRTEEALLAEREKASNSQVEMSMQIEQLEEKIKTMEAAENQQQQLIDNLTNSLETIRLEHELETRHQQQETEIKHSQYHLEIKSLTDELTRFRQIPANDQIISYLKEDLEQTTKTNVLLKEKNSALQQELNEQANEFTSLNKINSNSSDQIQALRETNEQLSNSISEIRNKNISTKLSGSSSMLIQPMHVSLPTVVTRTVPVEVTTPCPYDHEYWEREANLAKVCLDQGDIERRMLVEKADCFAKVASQKGHKLRLQKQHNLEATTEIRDLKRINHELTKQLDALQAELHHSASITEIKQSQMGVLATSITSLVNDLRVAVTPLSPMVVVPADPSDLNASVKELFNHYRILTGRR